MFIQQRSNRRGLIMERPYTIQTDWEYAKRELKRKYLQDLDEINKMYGNLLGRALQDLTNK